MSFAQLGGHDVIALRLSLPLVGAWTVRAELDTGDDAAPTGPVTLVFNGASSTVTFSGTVTADNAGTGAPVPGRSRVFMVGGANGMRAALPGKAYASVAPALVVEDLIRAAGEVVGSLAALQGAPARALWVRAAGPASSALTRFLAPLGLHWRVSTTGAVDVVAEAWPTYTGAPTLERSPDEFGRSRLALDMPDLFPGMLLFGRKVERVEHVIRANPDAFRTEVWST